MNATVRTATDTDGITTIYLDQPEKSVNTITPRMLEELDEAIVHLATDGEPRGIVIASARPGHFLMGADLDAVRHMDRSQLQAFIARGQQVFDRIASLPMPTVAAIGGDCLGGGLELALACTYRVAADHGAIDLGLPEIKLGIIPGWGGTMRLPERIGLTAALPMMLAGKTLPPRKALRIGLIDDVVRPEAILAAAKRFILRKPRPRPQSWWPPLARKVRPVRRLILAAARRRTLALTHGNYPAPLRLLEVVEQGCRGGHSAGLDAERLAVMELARTDAGRNLMRLFFLRQDARHHAADLFGAAAQPIRHAAVIGGGVMGAGIAHALIRRGLPVRLIDITPQAIAASLRRIRKLLDEEVAGKRLSPLQAKAAFYRVSPSVEWTGLELADVVIEAVSEQMNVKLDVFRKLGMLTRPDAVLASNTSALSIAAMGDACGRPQRVIGLHFFNPVHRMPLIEVVRTAASDDASLATGIALATRLGKTPLVVRDAPGFVVNRILVPYLAESLQLASEGVAIDRIDRAMKRWGMPMGPIELLDEIGLDVAAHVMRTLSPPAMTDAPLADAIERAMDRGWLGRKSGKGFYLHGRKRRPPTINYDMLDLLPVPAQASPPLPGAGAGAGTGPVAELRRPIGLPIGDQDMIEWVPPATPPVPAVPEGQIHRRLVLPMIDQAVQILDEGVVDTADGIDLATVLGLGMAPFRGGLARHADALGLDVVERQLQQLALEHGPRFVPSPALRSWVRSHRRMADARPAAARPTTRQPQGVRPW